MSVSTEQADDVKLLIERLAAAELYAAARLAMGLATVTGPDKGEIDDAFVMIVRKRSALELLDALAVTLSLAPAPQDNSGNQDEDVVAIVVGKSIATMILTALTISLGAEASSESNDGALDKGGDVVELIVRKFTAVDLFTSLVTYLGSAPGGMKAGKGGGDAYADITGAEIEGAEVEDGTTAKPGSPRSIPSPSVADEVDCTLYAPGKASPGNSFLVQVFAHLPEQAAVLEQLAQEADPDAKRRGGRTLDKKIQRGTRLTFNMTMPDLTIDEPSQSLIWRGKPESVQFAVTVPENFKPRGIACIITVCESSIPIGHLKFIFKVVAADAALASDARVQASLIRYQQAFISYASADRAEVLKRVQMLNASKVNFFQDLLTLEPGDQWEKLLYEYIDKSDVFFLFWSQAASESSWVGKEIAYARERQAGSAEAAPEIIPILIEGPPPAKPPEQLSFLHFNDKFLYFIKVEEEMAGAQ